MFELLFAAVRLKINTFISILETMHILSAEKADEIRATVDSVAESVIGTVDDTLWETQNNFRGAADEILSTIDDVKGSSDEWIQSLKDIQQEYNYTDADMDKFIAKLTSQDEGFEEAMGTLDGWKGSWRDYKKLLEETPASMDPAIQKQDELSKSVDGVDTNI